MPKLSEHSSGKVAKVMYIGDSGTGKTGSLASLVKDGYKLRVLDTDNGLDILRQMILHECPDKLDNVDYEFVRDDVEYKNGEYIVQKPKAFATAVKLLDKWTDESDPAEWGPETVFVLDSNTGFGKAAYWWARAMNPTSKDPRQWYFQAQQAVENTISKISSEEFNCNVVIIAHVTYKELQDGTTKGYPSAVGSALGPTIPKYFNTLLLAETVGFGKSVRRIIRTTPTHQIDLKTSAPFKVDAEYPLASGLSSIFKTLKGN